MLDEKTKGMLRAVRDIAERRRMTATLTLHSEKSHLMRIGNNSVSLNTSEELTRLDVEVTHGRSKGSHTHLGMLSSTEDAEAVLERAAEKARMASPKTYDPIPDRVEEQVSETGQNDPSLAELDPAVKAEAYSRIIGTLGEGYNFSGSWSSGATEVFLLTTGTADEAYHRGTDQSFTVVLKHPERKWELQHTQTGWRFSDFDAERTIEAFRRLLPVYEENEGWEVEPGDYTVIFGSEAVGEILAMAAWTGFSGRGWEEKQGWTARRRPGERILGENVSIVDAPENPLTFRFRFDMCGRSRKRFPLVEDGVLRGLMYDSATAARYGREPTGHDTMSPSLVMYSGEGPADPLQAVAGMGRVLWIPALHYMNIPSRSKGIFTGSSRFNALLVEEGRVVRPIFSSRVTDTFEKVLGNVRVISAAKTSMNASNTYGRRSPVAVGVPTYIVCEGVRITDCAESF